MTPLHYATMGGHAEVVSVLLEEGADIQAPRGRVRALSKYAGMTCLYLLCVLIQIL